MMKNKKGQVWVETVIYTLIALIMISLALAYVRPKIEEIQDKALIEDTLNMMEQINSKLIEMKSPGNQRVLTLDLRKGELKIDGINDEIIFEIETSYVYSQPDQQVDVGSVIAYTQTRGDLSIVSLIGNYSGKYNLTFQDKDELKTISHAAVPYELIIANNGGDKPVMDFEII